MSLRFHRLLKDGIPPVVLLAHRLGRRLHVVKRFRLHGCGVGDYGAGLDVDLQHRITARTRHFEVRGILRHYANHTAKAVYDVGPDVSGGFGFSQ